MASAISRSLLPYMPVTPKHSDGVSKLFDRVFQASIAPILVNPDRVKRRISSDKYVTQLYFHDADYKSLAGTLSMDAKPFKFKDISEAVRVHFLHSGGNPDLQKALLLKASAKAIDVHAQVMIFYVSNKNVALKTLLSREGFLTMEQMGGYITMKHDKIQELKASLEKPPVVNQAPKPAPKPAPVPPRQAPAPAAAPAAPQADGPPLPRTYKSMTLMRKYLHMIRDRRKPIEGRINTGAFGRVRLGDGFRFFYMQNKDDDVHCTVTELKTFRTFREMLEHFGWQKCVPDARSLDHAVEIYDKIPGYRDKAARFGVVGMRLRVDGHGPTGPANQVNGGSMQQDRYQNHKRRADSYGRGSYEDSPHPKSARRYGGYGGKW